MFPIAIVTLLLAIAVYGIFKTSLLDRRSDEDQQTLGYQPIPRYPLTLPFGTNLARDRKQAMRECRLNKFDAQQYQRMGSSTYAVHEITGNVVHTADPANLRALAVSQFDDWTKPDRKPLEPLFGGRGLMASNGSAWRRTRGLVEPLFKRAELNIDDFSKHTDRMIASIPYNGATVDMSLMLRKLFLDSSTAFIFGQSVDSQNDPSGKAATLIDTLNRALSGNGQRMLFRNWLPSVLIKSDHAWQRDCHAVHQIVDDLIAKSPSSPLSDRYVLLDGMRPAFPDPVDLRFELLNIFTPARETSATAFANVLFHLARHPDVWTELRSQALALGSLTPDLLLSLTDFRHVVFEALRLHAPIRKFTRVAVRDTVLPRGGGPTGSAPAFVSKGSRVCLDTFPSSRDPEIWGSDVDAFRPARFDGSERSLGWHFVPFWGGPRICPAHRQVMMQFVYLLVRLTRTFERIENRDECFEFVESARMCFESRNGCQVAFWE